MQAFTTHTGTMAPLPLLNIDTDMIIPKQFLKTIQRSGLGKNLFYEMRFDYQGREIADFVLNQPDYKNASILVAGANFGCGSSREHAPWALLDYGFRCIIAPSFADIFYNNCFKNGILPVILAEEKVISLQALAASTPSAVVTVDLEKQTVTLPDGTAWAFQTDDFRRNCLLKGLDDIGITLELEHKITAFEEQQRAREPWLYAIG